MFQRTLIPVDLSGRGHQAIEALPKPAAGDGGWVKLLHVIEAIDDGTGPELAGFYGALRAKAQKHLDALARELEQRGFDVQIEILIGKRSREILRCAEEDGCDTIVLASHRVEPGGHGFGTISQHVALLATCSVLLVR